MTSNEFHYAPYHEILDVGSVDPYYIFIASMPMMVGSARRAAREDAFSYRDFKVGAALFAMDTENGRTGIFSDGNWKMAPEFPKYCAEMSALDEANRAGYTAAIGVVIAATSDKEAIEGVTHKRTDTLHMCDLCIDKYDSSPLVDDDFLVLTSGTETDGYQCHTLGEMKQFYATKTEGETFAERFHHSTNNFSAWNERRLLIYDHLQVMQPHYRGTIT